MATNSSTSKQKADRGITPSNADIQERLKDPNSWESKLYDECLLVFDIKDYEMLQLARIITLEHKLAALELAAKENLRATRAQANESRYYAEIYSQQQIANAKQLNKLDGKADSSARLPAYQQLLSSLQNDMSTLLSISQQGMSMAQLAAHHKQVTANYNNQIAAVIGPILNVPVMVNNVAQNIALIVPQMASKPIASAADILNHNPAMPHTKRFAAHVTLAGMGYLAVLNKWRELLEHNREAMNKIGINVDDLQLTPQMLKSIDSAARDCLNDHPQLLMHLLENNLRAMGKTSALAQLPTLFAMRPSMGAARKKDENEQEIKPSSR